MWTLQNRRYDMDFVNVDLITNTNDGKEAEHYGSLTQKGVMRVKQYLQLLVDEGRRFILDKVGERETMEHYLERFESGCRTYNYR